MDMSLNLVAREATPGLLPGLNGLPRPAPPKVAKKPKKAVLFFEVEILDAKTREKLCFLDKVEPHATIAEIKNLFTKTHPQWYPARQSLRLDPKGKSLKDEDVLQKLPVGTTATLYFRDLGAQISWVTVFLTEYAGAPFHLPALLLPSALHLWPQIRLHVQSAHGGAPRLHLPLIPLRQAPAGDALRSPFLPWHHAFAQHLQELHLLLGLRRVDGLLHQPPSLHAPYLWSSAGETGARHLCDLPARQLLHPHGPAGPAARWVQDPEDPIPHQEPLHVALPAGVLPQLYLRGGVLDRFSPS
ncbi:hypothetical protein H8959_018352 [Pygathrix nigripes]